MKLLKKLFIKDYKNTSDKAVRFRYGLVAGILGIISNVILFALKITVGIIGASITVVADAVNNLSDAGSSVVTLVGFKLSSRPADKEHPFGHARYEYLTALIVSLITLAIGVLLMKSSVEKIIEPVAVTVTAFTYAVLGTAVVFKILQMLMYRDFAKSIDSGALRASAADSRNDVITTIAVLIATVVIDVAGVNIDGYMGAVVSAFIIISSIKLIIDTINPIIGTKPDEELVKRLKDKVMSYDGVIGIHDLMVHSYGTGVNFAIAHVEVPANVDALKSHDLIDNIEHDVLRELGIHFNIHMDPVDTEDEERGEIEERCKRIIGELDDTLSLHDLRIVRGETHNNVVMDVVIPFDSKTDIKQVKDKLDEEFSSSDKKYYFVVNMDR